MQLYALSVIVSALMLNPKPIIPLNIPQPKALKKVEGFAFVEILYTAYAGIIRPSHAPPWEAEILLVKGSWEEGKHKYYLVQLPKQDKWRPLGQTLMSKEHMANALSFDYLDKAEQAFNKASVRYDG